MIGMSHFMKFEPYDRSIVEDGKKFCRQFFCFFISRKMTNLTLSTRILDILVHNAVDISTHCLVSGSHIVVNNSFMFIFSHRLRPCPILLQF